MSELLTQAELEDSMYKGGIARALRNIEAAEEQGRAHTAPYGQEIIADYFAPLAEVIRSVVVSAPGVRMAEARLLEGVDPDAVAYLAIRTALSTILGAKDKENRHRNLGYEIGKTIHNELILAQFEEIAPELYYTLSRDLGRRLSKNERHRMTVMKMQAAKAGIKFIEWPISARHQVGLWLLDLLIQAGMIYLVDEPEYARYKNEVPKVAVISDEILKRIDQVKAYVSITAPIFGPTVEVPHDWEPGVTGGFHTAPMKRAHRALVRGAPGTRHLYTDHEMPTVYAAVNALQRTAWNVNGELLDIVLAVGKTTNKGEIVSNVLHPKPPQPVWLVKDMDLETLTEIQVTEFKKWKRSMADWYTDRKLSGVKYSRFYSATRSAAQYRDYPEIYFVHFADTRGRLYPMTYGLSPQGSDLQRGMLRFAEGHALSTPDAVKWFKIQGANKWGFDKATLEARVGWVDEREDLLLNIGADPIENREWMSADNPIQFLAWAMEYAQWRLMPQSFKSRLPISMDGSCNGLQNLSALLRDEIGGRATNLTDNAEMEDIYRRVAEAATQRMLAAERTPITEKWLAHGITRSAVKRGVMTTPYGVTRQSAMKYVIEDYLKTQITPFDKAEFRPAANELMIYVWPAIGDVVVKGRQAMDWLRKSSRVISKGFKLDDDPIITWISPSGFPAAQAYYESVVTRVRVKLSGEQLIRAHSESADPDINRHANGLAPNFVHSMDAAHLHRVSARMAREVGVNSLAMIHDDYGTHAAHSQRLYEVIREEFVAMYEENDPIAQFAERYPGLPKPPEKGKLNIREVLRSRYFFS